MTAIPRMIRTEEGHAKEAHDRRREPRLQPQHPVFPVVSDSPLRLKDASPLGCQLAGSPVEDLREGQFIEVDFGNDIKTKAIVRWCRGGVIGCEFTRPLKSADLDCVLDGGNPNGVRRL